MSTALTTQQKTLRAQVEKSLNVMRQEIVKALPKAMSPDRFSRVVLTEVTRNPKLLECDQTSFFCSLLLAAQMGLEPGVNGSCYLLPFSVKGNMQCQFILGFRGMIDLARRSGAIESIHAELVYEADEFKIELGLSPNIIHVPKMSGDRGNVIAGYSVAQFKDGGKDFIWMTEEEFEKVRMSSKAKDYGPWKDWPLEMKKKTLIRRHFKTLPVSIEIQSMAAQDEVVKQEFRADLTEPQPGETLEEVEAKVVESTTATAEDKEAFYSYVQKKGLSQYLAVDEKTKIAGTIEKAFLQELMGKELPSRKRDVESTPTVETAPDTDDETVPL